jgi:hypothetical protein
MEQITEFFNKPKLQVTSIVSGTSDAVLFDITNTGKNTAVNIRARVIIRRQAGKFLPYSLFLLNGALKWRVQNNTENPSIDLAYKEDGQLTWFTKSFEIKFTGDKYEYRMDKQPIGDYAKGDVIVPFELHLVAARGLEKKSSGEVIATCDPSFPVEIKIDQVSACFCGLSGPSMFKT